MNFIKTSNILKSVLLLSIFVFSSYAYSEENVVFAIDIIRHGDRTPTVQIPNSPYNWPEGLGELTAKGMKQEFNLGKKLRNLYVKQYRLLSPEYTNDSVYVRSSNFNRTLMSAESLLFGLYPLGTGPKLDNSNIAALPMLYQPIPIHTIPQKQDSLLIPGENQPDFKPLIQKYVISSASWQKKSEQFKLKLQRWSAVTGMEIKELYQIIPLADNLYVRKSHNIPMPKGITTQDQDEIFALSTWVAENIYQSYEVSSYASKELRASIFEYLQNASLPDTKLKYVLFLAHDSTLMAIMGGLQQPLTMFPSYASDLQILLIRGTAGRYYVKLNFNGQQLKLANCVNECSLENFYKYYLGSN